MRELCAWGSCAHGGAVHMGSYANGLLCTWAAWQDLHAGSSRELCTRAAPGFAVHRDNSRQLCKRGSLANGQQQHLGSNREQCPWAAARGCAHGQQHCALHMCSSGEPCIRTAARSFRHCAVNQTNVLAFLQQHSSLGDRLCRESSAARTGGTDAHGTGRDFQIHMTRMAWAVGCVPEGCTALALALHHNPLCDAIVMSQSSEVWHSVVLGDLCKSSCVDCLTRDGHSAERNRHEGGKRLGDQHTRTMGTADVDP
mmetsp:Transcript_14411/g.23042  ORF Transcript_14411/g.23042 Transcript_14411/m.23042 type:complete len:255 (+) Transcript_14411:692-1456(+)